MMKQGSKIRGVFAALVMGAALVLPGVAATAEEAPDRRQQRDSIVITKDQQFNAANGVRSGSGTAADPYVISGWELHHLELRDTSKHVMITGNTIHGALILNWAGPGIHVHDNQIGNLLVNQNVRRTGAATSGGISHNKIDVVGQLRHYDGVFSHNVVGLKDGRMWDALFSRRAVNFDGFNGASFTDNVIYGYMDARLHGHHHSSGFEDTSHHHGTQHEGHMDMVDHSHRYHQVTIANNKIYTDNVYALAYLDTGHAGNDRTAASERDEALNAPHVHYTRVSLVGNDLVGGGLWVDVFNAKDRLHREYATGSMTIEGNNIKLQQSNPTREPWRGPWRPAHGIYVWQARDMDLRIAGNRIAGPETQDPLAPAKKTLYFNRTAGIALEVIDRSSVRILDNTVLRQHYGVRAAQMTKTVDWVVKGLKTDAVDERVSYDESVANPPRNRP